MGDDLRPQLGEQADLLDILERAARTRERAAGSRHANEHYGSALGMAYAHNIPEPLITEAIARGTTSAKVTEIE